MKTKTMSDVSHFCLEPDNNAEIVGWAEIVWDECDRLGSRISNLDHDGRIELIRPKEAKGIAAFTPCNPEI